MVVKPMWKVRLAIFQGVAGAWLRDIFSSPKARADRYRQTVVEEAFETWMNYGQDFSKAIEDRIAAAKNRGAHNLVRFWQDVFTSAHDFDADPQNRRKRVAMTFVDSSEEAPRRPIVRAERAL
ncbi:MAG: hypothetical protein V4527_05175 [Pseudomonadota bacterium]